MSIEVHLSAGQTGNVVRTTSGATAGLLGSFPFSSILAMGGILPIILGAFATMGLVGHPSILSPYLLYCGAGNLVDDAIVVGESVYTLGSKGKIPAGIIMGTHLYRCW